MSRKEFKLLGKFFVANLNFCVVFLCEQVFSAFRLKRGGADGNEINTHFSSIHLPVHNLIRISTSSVSLREKCIYKITFLFLILTFNICNIYVFISFKQLVT